MTHGRDRPRLLALGIPAIVLALALGAPPVAAQEPDADSADAILGPTPRSATKSDRDGDLVVDDLEVLLADDPGIEQPVIVRVDDPGRIEAIATALDAETATPVELPIVSAVATELTREEVAQLTQEPGVVAIEADEVMRATNGSAGGSIGASQVRADLGVTGDRDGIPAVYSNTDITVAVIDTGIHPSHVDLDGGKIIAWYDVVNASPTPYDDHGHGSHIAATIAGTGEGSIANIGMAPGASLVGIKVLDGNGQGYSSQVVAGIQWAIANKAAYGIDIINLSLGGTGCSAGTDTVSTAVNQAKANGIAVMVAAGNDGPARCTIGSPGAAAGGFTVAAVADLGATGGFAAQTYSSAGPTADGRAKPDAAVPGTNITSAKWGTATSYQTMSGTSMATGVASGVAALVLDANPALTPDDLYGILRATAQDWARGGDDGVWAGTGWDTHYGAGIIDADEAVRAAAGAGAGSNHVLAPHFRVEGVVPSGGSLRIPVTVSDTRLIGASLILADVTAATSANPDLDIYWYRPGQSTSAATGDTIARVETLTVAPSVGTNEIEIRSYAGTAEFVLDLSGGIVAPPTLGQPQIASVRTGQSQATISWQPPAGGPAPALYTIVSDQAGAHLSVPGGSTSAVVTGLTTGASYSFRVVAQNLSGGGPASAAVIATPATFSPFTSGETLVSHLYEDFLLRGADSGGLSYWSARVYGGTTAADLAESFFASPEFEGRIASVARLYAAVYLRTPDFGGLDYWMRQRTAGAGLDWIANYFAVAPEFASRYGNLDDWQFVERVYTNVLGRAPDPQGQYYWAIQLARGRLSRGTLLLGFSDSPEFRSTSGSRIDATLSFYGLLRRMPNDAELNAWIARLDGPENRVDIIREILNSTEYAARFGL